MAAVTARESVGKNSLTSRASTVITDFPSDEQRPEDLSNEELLQAVENLQTANRQLFLENEIFENFLKRTDPPSMIGFEKLVEQATAASNAQNRVQAIASSMLQPISSAVSMSNLSTRRGTTEDGIAMSGMASNGGLVTHKSYSVMKFGTGSVLDRGPRINLHHKVDMVTREMEELRLALEKMQAHSKRTRADLRAQLEQFGLMIREVKDSDQELTRDIIIGGVDSLTHTIPAEKFVRHMEEWLRRADSMVGKLRLKTSTMRALNIRVQAQLVQKLELGETLHPVDFDQLRIENAEHLKKIEQKNQHLLELKKMTGKCNLQLVNFKDRLAKELKELRGLQAATASKNALIDSLNKESLVVEVDVAKAEEQLYKVKYIRDNFTVPDVLQYAKVKDEMFNLKKEVKVWTRRLTVQHISLGACLHALQRVSNVDVFNQFPCIQTSKTAQPTVNQVNPQASVEKDKVEDANISLERRLSSKEQGERRGSFGTSQSTDVIRASIGSLKKEKFKYEISY